MYKMTEEHRRFISKETIKAFFINMIINCVISYVLVQGRDSFMLWGKRGLFVDNIANTFFMALIVATITNMVARGQVRKGKAPAIPWDRREHPVFRYLPASSPIRGLVVAIFCLAALIPTSTGLLTILMEFPMSITEYLVFKAIYGGVIGAVVTPIVIPGALSDKPVVVV